MGESSPAARSTSASKTSAFNPEVWRSASWRRSIAVRNPYVDPLSFIQLVLLKRLRAAGEQAGEELTAVLESINGIASGLKNTG